MSNRMVYEGQTVPGGSRRLLARPAVGAPYELRAALAPSWGYEGDAPRQTAAALLLDLSGHTPLPHQVWDLVVEWVGDARLCPPRGSWAIAGDDLDLWRRAWFRRPSRRLVVERAFVGALLRTPAEVQLDPDALADRRDREVVRRVVAGVRSGRPPGLDTLQDAVDAMRQGAEPDFVRGRLEAAPDGPGPHVWAARLQAVRAATTF